MAKSLSILYVTSEVYPFIKVGGLADTGYAFSLAVRDFGHDIRVMLPKYGNVSERKNKIHEINRLKDMPITVGPHSDLATVKSSSINNPRVKVQIYITTNGTFFDQKKAVYADPKTGIDFPDNDERFIFFNKTVVETCMLLGWVPDIIHCNDWQSALIPAYIKLMYPNKFKKTKVIFTIHNFAKQGVFPSSTFDKTGFGKELKKSFIHKNSFNFMKPALMYADYITTNSQEYAKEIMKNASYSDGLNKILAERSDKFTGLNLAYDNYQWNPKNDAELTKKLGTDIEDFKEANKRLLCTATGLKYNQRVPIMSIVSKLNEQKGITNIIENLEALLKNNLQLVVLGVGDGAMTDTLKNFAKKNHENFAFINEFDDKLAHLIFAGSDYSILPSLISPSGLTGIYSLNYGAVPIANVTGSLKEILSNIKPETNSGNSFVFDWTESESFSSAINQALETFKDKDKWLELSSRCISNDISWEKTIKRYDEIYKLVLKEDK